MWWEHLAEWIPHNVSQVGWSTARDYYTFLWSPLPERYVEGTAVNRTAVFQGKIDQKVMDEKEEER